MKAVVIERYGDINELVERELPTPEPGPGELLVEIHATALNPVDAKIRQGHLQDLFAVTFHRILGGDISGIVRRVGSGATDFAPGDEVYFLNPLDKDGGYAEFITVDQSIVAAKPKSLTHVEAAALPVVALTSIQALRDFAKLRRGDKVLIHGGAGGVGSIAIQYAKILGAEVYTTVSPEKIGYARSLGADHIIDYTTQDFVAVAREAGGMDIVFETVGGDNYVKSLMATKDGGAVPCIVHPPSEELRQLAASRDIKTDFFLLNGNRQDLDELTRLVDDGKIRPSVGRTLGFDGLRAAHQELEAGRSKGKLVLKIK